MAVGTSLVIAYNASDGGTTTHTWKYAKTTATLSQVQALIASTITNKTIFEKQPETVRSAKLVTTTETEFDIDSVMTANGNDLRAMIAPPDEIEGTTQEITRTLPYESVEAKRARLEAELAALR